jgi:hypothetical protein
MEKIKWVDALLSTIIFAAVVVSAGFLLYGYMNASPETQELILLINAAQEQQQE